MITISRYLSREFFRIFLLSIVAFLVLYLIVDLFERMSMLMKYEASLLDAFHYFLYKTPLILFQVIPVAVLLGTLLSLGILNRNNEITALKAGGVSLYRIVLPFLVIGILASGFSFFLNEFIIPDSNRRLKFTEMIRIKKRKSLATIKQNKIYLRSRNSIYNIDFYLPKKNLLQGISILRFDRDFRLVQRIDAKRARWNGNVWNFEQGTIRDFRGSVDRIESFSERVIPFSQTPKDFELVEREPEEMSYGELKKYLKKLKGEGFDTNPYLADLQAKLSFPLINLIIVLIGLPFALQTGRRPGYAKSVGLSILIGFSYWITFAFSLSLGRSGALNPIIAAWAPDILFAASGIFLLTRVHK
ncbi:MAG: LPS export ABC transporter permease LptG [Deltaproteobacteria bacterium]|nr:MAG: LPS export ABC transporter permease LptG [Deltaproteobacteria bacterium]